MRSVILICLLVVFCIIRCTKVSDPIPECIQQKIDSIKQEPPGNVAAGVHLYMFDGRKVYLFSATCCDAFVEVLDASCTYVCSPSGGLTGTGDGKCAEFYQQAQYLGIIWKDDR